MYINLGTGSAGQKKGLRLAIWEPLLQGRVYFGGEGRGKGTHVCQRYMGISRFDDPLFRLLCGSRDPPFYTYVTSYGLNFLFFKTKKKCIFRSNSLPFWQNFNLKDTNFGKIWFWDCKRSVVDVHTHQNKFECPLPSVSHLFEYVN